jgi:hypothetical protein
VNKSIVSASIYSGWTQVGQPLINDFVAARYQRRRDFSPPDAPQHGVAHGVVLQQLLSSYNLTFSSSINFQESYL